MDRLVLARQFMCFGAIGMAATLTHVAIAWFAYSSGNMHPGLANLLGASAAFFVSFCSNRSLTFKSRRPVSSSALRYMIISLVSYFLATAIMLTTERLGLPTYLFACLVMLTVPPVTFVLAKFWAFSEDLEKSSKREAKGCK